MDPIDEIHIRIKIELKYAVPVIQIALVVGVQYREYIKRNINTLNMHFRNWHVMWTR